MLTITGMTKAFGARVLFEDASLQVNRGDRIGLVGPNGAGKSTLLSLGLGHARTSGAAARATAGPLAARRADQPSRPRSAPVVSGIFEDLSRRHPLNLA